MPRRSMALAGRTQVCTSLDSRAPGRNTDGSEASPYVDVDGYLRPLRLYPCFCHCSTDEGDGLFTYAEPDVPQLARLRTAYSLCAVAGEGNAWDKAIRLSDWTFEQLFCVGPRINPESLDSLSILAHRQEGSLYCSHKSIVLHEALLSVGIPSRLLWCYPYRFDSDCHVVVILYVAELAKWVFVDPTFNTYFHDDSGKPLSVLEVRSLYHTGHVPKFRHIAIDKQWALVMNGVICDTYDQWYQLYMAKNCFRFSSPADNRFGCSGDAGVARVFLNPSGFDMVNEYDRYTHSPDTNIYTTSASAFFSRP